MLNQIVLKVPGREKQNKVNVKNATDHDVTLHLSTGYYKRSLCRRAYFSSFIPIVFYATHRNFLMVCYFLFKTTIENILHCNKWINVSNILLNHLPTFYESYIVLIHTQVMGVHNIAFYFLIYYMTGMYASTDCYFM